MRLKNAVAAVAGFVLVTTGAAGTAAASTVYGTEYFTITITGNDEGVVAHGLFKGHGRDGANHENYDVLHLKHGHLRIYHPDKKSHFSFKLYPKSCYARISGHGTYTLSHGTGRFRGVHGHGHYKVEFKTTFPQKSDGSCDFNGEGYEVGVVHAHGPASL